ncbi:MAG: hypothetical protein AAGG08_08170 [Actinomycetota bacterium]
MVTVTESGLVVLVPDDRWDEITWRGRRFDLEQCTTWAEVRSGSFPLELVGDVAGIDVDELLELGEHALGLDAVNESDSLRWERLCSQSWAPGCSISDFDPFEPSTTTDTLLQAEMATSLPAEVIEEFDGAIESVLDGLLAGFDPAVDLVAVARRLAGFGFHLDPADH